MNAAFWIFATLVTEWALKTIWRDYIEPPLVRRSHAKAAADREEEAREREYFGSVSLTITPDTTAFEAAIENVKRRPSPGVRVVTITAEERIANLAARVERALGGA